tara:strand:- start:2778 stop:3020 length:243 start_codon:yes stop_codon:yes gene_type:complete
MWKIGTIKNGFLRKGLLLLTVPVVLILSLIVAFLMLWPHIYQAARWWRAEALEIFGETIKWYKSAFRGDKGDDLDWDVEL